MAKVLKHKYKGTLAERREKRRAAWIARNSGNYIAKTGEKLVRVGIITKELESYIPGHVKATSFIYDSEESELSRMIKIADRIALRIKK